MRNVHIGVRAIAGIALLVGIGCKDKAEGHEGTPGQEGRVDFSYRQGCFFGCPLEQPLLMGSKQIIALSDAGDAAGARVASSKPAVAEVALERACVCQRRDNDSVRVDIAEDANCDAAFRKHCDNALQVRAKAAGESELSLRDESGALIDRVMLHVREADRVRIEVTYPDKLGSEQAGALELGAGDKLQLEAEFYAKDGKKLLATEGVSWSVGDDAVAIVTAWLIGSGKQVSAGTDIELQAKTVGATELTVSVAGLEQTLDVMVAEP